MEKYKSKIIINAILFTEGMEDGVVTRYYNSMQESEDGAITTWGMQTGEEDSEYSVPYILNKEGKKIFSAGFDREYLCETPNKRWLIDKKEFELKYELI